MSISESNTRIIITMPKELKEELQEIAKEDKRSISNTCVKILSDYVKNKKGGE